MLTLWARSSLLAANKETHLLSMLITIHEGFTCCDPQLKVHSSGLPCLFVVLPFVLLLQTFFQKREIQKSRLMSPVSLITSEYTTDNSLFLALGHQRGCAAERGDV